MTDPITIPVATNIEGLELIETLGRRGLAATLVSRPQGWQVEVAGFRDRYATLLDELAIALDGSTQPLPDSSAAAARSATPHPDDWRGFRVESDEGRIGVVARVHPDARSGRPERLVVRGGRIGLSVLLVAAADVEVVTPAARRLRLRSGWTPVATSASPATVVP